MIKLHLGCGTRYLDGYINIDHPPTEHSVQQHLVADRYVDIRQLDFPASSVDEIRLHHVFEHFPRQIALALLCKWVDWLKPGGVLHIETPDVMRSAWAFISPFATKKTRNQIIRHLFGSHEASWAAHWDGWYAGRFKETLRILGFESIRCYHTRWGALRNIEVIARRGANVVTSTEHEERVKKILADSLVTHVTFKSVNSISDSEIEMLKVWMDEWRDAYFNGVYK